MARKRGIASVKKRPSKYIIINEDGEETDDEDDHPIKSEASKDDAQQEEEGKEENRVPPTPPPKEPQQTARDQSSDRKQSKSEADLVRLLFGVNSGEGPAEDEVRESIEQDPATLPLPAGVDDSAYRGDSGNSATVDFSRSPGTSPYKELDSVQRSPPIPRSSSFINRSKPSTLTNIDPRPSAPPKRKRTKANTIQIQDSNPLPSPNTAANMSFIPTSQQRHMRACMVCSIVRTYTQFMQQGCPNCDSFLELVGNSDAIQDCTSQVFDGLLTVSNTSRSWVARYQRLEGYVPGVYAIQVEGVLPEDAILAVETAGVQYIPRDGSVSEALPTTDDRERQ